MKRACPNTFNLIFTISFFVFLFTGCTKDSDEVRDEDEVAELVPPDPSNPKRVPFPQVAVESIPYSEINEKEYVIETARWDIPTDRRDPIKTTDNLQKAIDWAAAEGYGRIRLPKGHYLIGKYGNDIYQAGIELKSSMAFLLDKEAVIEMAPNDKWNYCAIAVTEKQYVVISGGTIIGDRDNHTYTPRERDGSQVHDEGHLICIQNESAYVTVENVTLTKANGDGILLVGQKGEGSSVKHIQIRNNNFSNNRRQGISVVGAEDLVIEKNEIHHTKGTAPQFGIDIESAIYKTKDVRIQQNYLHHNRGGDIVNVDGEDVVIQQNILHQGEGNKYIDGPLVYKKQTNQIIGYNDITMLSVSVNNWNGIIMYSNKKEKRNDKVTIIEHNTCNNCGFFMYDSRDLVVRNNTLNKGHVAFRDFKNLTIINNTITHPGECWAYRFLRVSGSASGNTYNGEEKELPLQIDTPWDGCWIR